jgi:hypothetical protein
MSGCIEFSEFKFPVYGDLFGLGQRLFSDKYISVAAALTYAPAAADGCYFQSNQLLSGVSFCSQRSYLRSRAL